AWFKTKSFETALEKAKKMQGEDMTITGALLKTRKAIVNKKGDRMSFYQCEDTSGSAEIIVFPKTFAVCEKWLSSYHVFLIKGIVDVVEGASCKIKAQHIVPIELVLSDWPHIEHIQLNL